MIKESDVLFPEFEQFQGVSFTHETNKVADSKRRNNCYLGFLLDVMFYCLTVELSSLRQLACLFAQPPSILLQKA